MAAEDLKAVEDMVARARAAQHEVAKDELRISAKTDAAIKEGRINAAVITR